MRTKKKNKQTNKQTSKQTDLSVRKHEWEAVIGLLGIWLVHKKALVFCINFMAN